MSLEFLVPIYKNTQEAGKDVAFLLGLDFITANRPDQELPSRHSQAGWKNERDS